MSDNFVEEQIKYYLEDLRGKTQNGLSLDAAVAKMKRHPLGTPPEDILNTAVDRFRTQTKVIVEYDTAESITREYDTGRWYAGPKEDDVYWPHLKEGLQEKIGDAVDAVDEASSKVVASLRDRKSTRLNSSHVSISYA